MFTAISSLNLHQSYLDVVANNLANANTTGYKANRVMFQDQYSQLINGGSAPTASRSGTNPIQIGLGVQAGFISPNFIQGALQSTGRNHDLAIQGDGFFVFNSVIDRTYSREGSMAVSSDGFLVNSSTGMRAQGWSVDASGNVDTNLPVTDISIPLSRSMASATTQASFTGNLNADLTAMPIPNPGDPLAVPPIPATPGGSTRVTLAAFDSLGNVNPIDITFTRVSETDWTWDYTFTDPAGVTTTVAPAGTLQFDGATGHLGVGTATTGTININPGTGAANINATIDFSNMTMFNSPNSTAVAIQDGLPAGSVNDVTITPIDGSVYLIYSNGMREKIGQMALARFTNPEGLIAAGHTMFKEAVNSGNAQIGTALTGGRGSIASGYLEGSNVDMAREFTNMILAQRGFQASSRVITTSDEIIQELVNLKR
jgi:flagellar hook protein FlgE